MNMLKPGDICPICGRTIKTEDPEALELLSCYNRVFELMNKGTSLECDPELRRTAVRKPEARR